MSVRFLKVTNTILSHLLALVIVWNLLNLLAGDMIQSLIPGWHTTLYTEKEFLAVISGLLMGILLSYTILFYGLKKNI